MTASPLSYGPFISKAQAKAQGLKHYFTGKPCKHGHLTLRYVSVGQCCQCAYESHRQFSEQRSEKSKNNLLAKKRAAAKAWRQNHASENYERVKASQQKHYQAYRARQCQYLQRRRSNDKAFSIVSNLRDRLKKALIASKNLKSQSAKTLLGCTPAELVQHLEAMFLPGMSWDNYGLRGWHVDHIRPCASFDLADPEQQRECFHYSNLQPLWAEDNLAKSDNWEPVAA